MTLGEIIKEYRQEHGVSQDVIAERANLSKAYISILERNINPKTGGPPVPSIKTIYQVAKAIDSDFDSVFSRLDHDAQTWISDKNPIFGLNNVIPMPATVKKPRLGVIACGEPILAEENIEGYDDVPDWVKCDFTLLCKGDSMIGARINDGDIVCIKAQETAEEGQIAAVLVDGDLDSEATLKRVRYMKDGVALWPENPAYPPYVYTGEDANRVHIKGVATHFISKVL